MVLRGIDLSRGVGVVCGVLVGFVVLLCGWCGGGVAFGVVAEPAWEVTTAVVPSVLPSGLGRRGKYDVVVENVGGAASSGEFAVKDILPAGLSVTGIEPEFGPTGEEPSCGGSPGEVVCTSMEGVVSGGFVVVNIEYEVTGSVSGLTDVASVSGGGAVSEASGEAVSRLGAEGETGPGGIAQFKFGLTGLAGEPVTQAGGHPYFLNTSVLFNNLYFEGTRTERTKPVEAVKDLVFYLPLGMLGDPAIADPCPASIVEVKQPEVSGCPPASRVGSILPMVFNSVHALSPDPTHVIGLYSVQPEKGYAAEFAFATNNLTFLVYASVVRHDGAYMLRVATPGVPQAASLIGLVTTFYGDLQEHFSRGGKEYSYERGAFLTDPTNCGEGLAERSASVAANTWEDPNPELPFTASTPAFASLTGCELLGFSAGLSVKPETTQADEPSGYEVGLEFPQAPNDWVGLGTPPMKNTSVTFPEGATISPSSANGLQACQATGPEGINIEGAESEALAPDGLEHPVGGHCPSASQIASVEGVTPLLHEALTGHIFLAAPGCGGSGQGACTDTDAENGTLFGLYLELEAPGASVVIKLKGHASVQPGSGRVTAVFDEIPQFPVSKLVTKLKQGPRAPIANPQVCGPADSSAVVAPWSEPATPSSTPSDFFNVDWDGAGGACPSSGPFSPSFAAGTVSATAGSTSGFSLTLKREDREQNVFSLSSTLPEGMLANIAKFARCPEPQASEASLDACPAASQIGTTTVSVGPGSEPYYVTGKVFLTEPYDNAPFGLSIVVPAVAGPFDLGDVLVRVALRIDPRTLQVKAESAELPAERDGVPLEIRTVNLSLSSQFTVNPTSCAKSSITGEVKSRTGAVAGVASSFATSGCKDLAFKPVLTGSTESKSTKANGTGVAIKIVYPTNVGEANLAKLVLSFPTQLPVRLSTLQQACRAATFEANPAACPSASDVGSATVHSPLIKNPLTGPAYLVSYGSTKFPDVVFVLQGEGVTLDVDSTSKVATNGVLTVTVPSTPDAPFSTFETVLPRGPYSVFTNAKSTAQAQASQCGENLLAPVTMTAQNGAQITAKAKVAVAGCKAPGAKVSLVSAKASGGALKVAVKTSVRGRVTVSGPGLKTLTRKGVGAGTHKLTVALTAAGRAAVRARKKVQVTVGLVAGKQKVSKRKKITL